VKAGPSLLGLPVIARLTEKLPELCEAAEARSRGFPPLAVYTLAGEAVELRNADDFEPWWGLKWSSVRVLRYRQHRKKEVVEAYWLTDLSPSSSSVSPWQGQVPKLLCTCGVD